MPNNDANCSIEKMRVASRLVAQVLDHIEDFVVPDITTQQLDEICRAYIVDELKAYPACFDTGFPGAACISVNQVVCHGVPSDKKLKQGDMVNIDVVIRKDGHHGDHSRMFHVGKPKRLAERLATVTYDAMMKSIDSIRPGLALTRIGEIIDTHVRTTGYSVVHDLCGHGIGLKMHEWPQVLHFVPRQSQPKVILEPGMTFTVEPIVNAGKRHVRSLRDGWTESPRLYRRQFYLSHAASAGSVC